MKMKGKGKRKETKKKEFKIEKAEASSYVPLAPAPKPKIEEEGLPKGYGDNRIVLQIVDPYWLHSYWEITEEKKREIKKVHGEEVFSKGRVVLRVYDITGIDFDGTNAKSFYDIDIQESAGNWYINVPAPNKRYCVDIGIVDQNGRFILLARSNFVNVPRTTPSEETDIGWDYDKVYSKLKKHIVPGSPFGVISSPGIGSFGFPEKRKGFRFFVDTELIVYGATEPDAKVTIQGKAVNLNPDGTFSARFALPDGVQVIPVEAEAKDKSERRKLTPVISRKME
ncbi:MAG: DUF4912 domain-containing protein [Candidatus Thermoplasmatota archaeon]